LYNNYVLELKAWSCVLQRRAQNRDLLRLTVTPIIATKTPSILCESFFTFQPQTSLRLFHC